MVTVPTRIITDSWRPEEAYIAGWQDHADALETAGEGAEAGRHARRLDALLDRMYAIAPYELPEVGVFDAEVQ